MKYLKSPVGTVIYSFLFAFLFYHKPPGINVLFFELPLLVFLIQSGKSIIKRHNSSLIFYSTLLLLFAYVLHGSLLTMIIHILSLVTLTGMAIYPQAKTLFWPFISGFFHSIATPFYMVQQYRESKAGNATGYVSRSILRYVVIPIGLLLVFSALYSFANPIFLEGMDVSLMWLYELPAINTTFILLFILGCLITRVFVYSDIGLVIGKRSETGHSDQLQNPHHKTGVTKHIQNEYRMVMIILIVLNILLCLMNYSDIRFVWIDFLWTGEHLKMFVHQGTYALIISILISMVMVVYFFRKDLNFYKNRKSVRLLANLWIIQNGILAVSVLIRNYHYIHYFSLAYRRIGMIFFVGAVFYGLYTVWIKINERQSVFYLLRVNSISIYLALVCMALVPWDNVIARYNLNSNNKGFVHLEYLATLSDKALNDLDADHGRLFEIERIHTTKFDYEEDYIGAVEYKLLIDKRINSFNDRMSKSHWLSYNLADYLTWQDIKKDNRLH